MLSILGRIRRARRENEPAARITEVPARPVRYGTLEVTYWESCDTSINLKRTPPDLYTEVQEPPTVLDVPFLRLETKGSGVLLLNLGSVKRLSWGPSDENR